MPSSKTSKKLDIKKIFSETVTELAVDMPLLMHGAGDAGAPHEVSPQSASLVAALTTEYISQLVDAALDSQSMYADGKPLRIPPPPLLKPLSPAVPTNDQKRKSTTEEYWDDPDPPKVRLATTSHRTTGDCTTSSSEWVGVAGVDFFRPTRRAAYVQAPCDALTTQSFIFPICHDVYAYGRVMEVQAAKRSLEPVLLDSVWMETVRMEGGISKKKKKTKTDDPEDDEDDEEVEEEEDENGPSWPGLESILPVYRKSDNTT